METTDRLWWLLGLFGLGLAAGAAAFPVWLLSTSLPLDAELGLPITRDLLLASGFAAFFLIMALVLTIMAVRARVRTSRRAAALRGRVDAMPLARLTVDAAKAPDVSAEPLVLSWRATKSTRYVQGPLMVLQMLAAVAGIGVSVFGLGFVVFSDRVPDPFRLLAGVGMPVLLALTAAGGVIVVRIVPMLFGRPYGVSADGEGITARTVFGRRRFLPWSDMRLLEVASFGSAQSAVRRFQLYGSRVRVAWSDGSSSPTQIEPADISAEEMALRQRALLDLIAARTGLVPRTFSRALKTADPGTVPKAGAGASDALTTAGAFAVIIGIFLVPAAAVLLLPLTASALFNEAMAAPLALVALLVVGAGVLPAFQGLVRSRVPIPAAVSLPGAPPLDAPHTTYVLTLRVPPLRRLGFALSGLLMAIEIAPALLAILTLPTLHVPGTGALPQLQRGGYPLVFVLALFGLMGFALIYAAVRSTTIVIRADAAGLSINLTRSPSFLSWDSVEDIAARMGRRQITAYQAKGDAGRVTISWSALRSQVGHGTPSDGALPISPDELAALVVERSGKSLRLASRL